jgi:hypothetical protein
VEAPVAETKKVDADGKTLEEWLEELEKDKSNRLSRDMDKRTPPSNRQRQKTRH